MKTPMQRRPALRFSAIAPAILLLTAFVSPDDRPPPTAPVQQIIPQEKIPKSWIPEFPKDKKDPLVFRSTPQIESAIAGDTELGPDCPIPIGQHWGEVMKQSDYVHGLIKRGRLEEARQIATELMRLTETAADRYLILTMFGAIFEKAGNKPGQAEALVMLLGGNCFLIPGEKALLQKKLDAIGKPSN